MVVYHVYSLHRGFQKLSWFIWEAPLKLVILAILTCLGEYSGKTQRPLFFCKWNVKVDEKEKRGLWRKEEGEKWFLITFLLLIWKKISLSKNQNLISRYQYWKATGNFSQVGTKIKPILSLFQTPIVSTYCQFREIRVRLITSQVPAVIINSYMKIISDKQKTRTKTKPTSLFLPPKKQQVLYKHKVIFWNLN